MSLIVNNQVHAVLLSVTLRKGSIWSFISAVFFGRAAAEEVKVSAVLSEKAQHSLHGSISNSLTGTNTHTHTVGILNEAAAQNNLPDRGADTKQGGQKGKTSIIM